MKINEIKEKYKDEWVLVEVLEEDKEGNPEDVKLICHSKDRDETNRAMIDNKDKYTYHFYNGKMPKDYVVVFYGNA